MSAQPPQASIERERRGLAEFDAISIFTGNHRQPLIGCSIGSSPLPLALSVTNHDSDISDLTLHRSASVTVIHACTAHHHVLWSWPREAKVEKKKCHWTWGWLDKQV